MAFISNVYNINFNTAFNIMEIRRGCNRLYPDNEYLFMRNSQQILGDTFNEQIKKVCNTLNIKYRSSHQLRFTVATMLFEGGMPITKLSVLLGHSNTAMTWHYIRQQTPDAKDLALMESILD